MELKISRASSCNPAASQILRTTLKVALLGTNLFESIQAKRSSASLCRRLTV
uniref:Uncharacterized protein n=1 Tax=Arundo donax TaxID=35708 RepID=A0A0A9GVZ3_ARUDO